MSSSDNTPSSSVTTPDETYQSPCRGEVIDIGGSQLTDTLKKVFQKKLIGKDDQNRHFLCDFFFSDNNGLAIWKKINCLPDYYQTDHEVELLKNHGKDIASYIKEGTAIIDLGCGDVRKVKPLLDHLEASGTNVQYYALDLSKKAVEDNMLCYSSNYKHVECFGLWGTFEDGMKWSKALQKPRLFLSLGSIFGNDRFQRAVKYLKMCAGSLRPADHILLGIDVCQSKEEVWNSYHDSGGLFEEFVRNAFEHSNRILGPWYRHDDWIVSGILEGDPHFHRFVLKAVNDVLYAPAGVNFAVGDEVECYEGFKQTPVLYATAVWAS